MVSSLKAWSRRLKRDVTALYFAARDPRVPWYAKAVALIVAVPWSIPYLRVHRETGAGRNLYEAEAGSAVVASYLQVPPANLLYGRTGWLRPSPSSRLVRKDGAEQALFPGFCALALALAGLLAAGRGSQGGPSRLVRRERGGHGVAHGAPPQGPAWSENSGRARTRNGASSASAHFASWP